MLVLGSRRRRVRGSVGGGGGDGGVGAVVVIGWWRGGGRADGWPRGGGVGGGEVRARTVCSRNAVYGGKNGGTAATSSGLNSRNGPNSFVFYFIITTIKHNIVFRNYRLVHNKYLNHLINCIECLIVINRRSSNPTLCTVIPTCYIYLYILQYFFVSFFNLQSNTKTFECKWV